MPRKLVLLCDVSGSMALYTRALLLFLHAAVGSGRGVEAFAFGTRLSRLTPDLSRRDPEAGLDRATAAAVDWGSGTRIGASVKELNDVYGRRALTRGAVVVVLSDGWEREDCALLGREMARLQRAALVESAGVALPTARRWQVAPGRGILRREMVISINPFRARH